MFTQPTKRAQRRSQRLVFHDSPSDWTPPPARSGWAAAKARASTMSKDPNWVDPPPLKATKDQTQTIRIEVPFDWNQHQITRYLGELARQGEANLSQLPHYAPKGFERVDFGEDAIIPMQSYDEPADKDVGRRTAEDAEPAMRGAASPMPDGNPKATTTGGTAGPGMLTQLVQQWVHEKGRYAFWPQTRDGECIIFRRELGQDEVVAVGRFPLEPDAYFHNDMSPSHFRLFRTSRQQADLGDTRPGLRAGREIAQVTGDRARQIAAISRGNNAAWRR